MHVHPRPGRAVAWLLSVCLGIGVLVGAPLRADAALEGSITGRVTASGEAVAGVDVYVYRYWGSGNYSSLVRTVSGPDGDYTAGGLPAGTYRVGFYPPVAELSSEWWRDGRNVDAGTDVEVLPAQTVTGIDPELDRSVRIVGRVTDSSGLPIRGVTLDVDRLGPDGQPTSGFSGYETDADGRFAPPPMHAGRYRVRFVGHNVGYLDEFWESGAAGDPTVLTLQPGDVADLDPQLFKLSRLTGVVTNTSGQPVAGACLDVSSPDHVHAYGPPTCTNNQGRYVLTGLEPSDRWRLYVNAPEPYLDEYWQDAETWGTSDFVAVGPESTAVADAVVDLEGVVSGRVTDRSGAPVGSVAVELFERRAGSWEEYGTVVWTDAHGRYSFDQLDPGSYRMQFRRRPYIPVWTGGSRTADSASVFEVTNGSSTSYDAVLTRGGRVSGQVTHDDGRPLAAGVYAYHQVDGRWVYVSGAEAAADGTFTIDGLPSGPYRLRYVMPYYYEDWSGNANHVLDAIDVDALEEEVVGGADTTLTPEYDQPPRVGATGRPAVSGSAEVGETVTATSGSWSESAVSLGYQWFGDGVAIAGATEATYRIGSGQAGRRLNVRVTATKPGHTTGTAVSSLTEVVAGDPEPPPPDPPPPDPPPSDPPPDPSTADLPGSMTVVSRPKLKGPAVVTKSLRIKPGQYAPGGGATTFRWLVDGRLISGATAATLRVKRRWLGRTITAEVTVRTPGYTTLVLVTKGKKVG